MVFCPFFKILCLKDIGLKDLCLKDIGLKDLCLTNDVCPKNNDVYLKDVCQNSVCLVLVYTYGVIGILLITLGCYMMEQQQQQQGIFDQQQAIFDQQGIFDQQQAIFDIKKIFEQQQPHQGIFEQQPQNKCILEKQECPEMLCNSSNFLVISILMLFLFVVDCLSNMFMHFIKFLMFATLFATLVVLLITIVWIAYNKHT